MSVQFFNPRQKTATATKRRGLTAGLRIFSVVFFVHIVGFSFLWVGFPVPQERPAADFVYQGALPMSIESGSRSPGALRLSGGFFPRTLDRFKASGFNRWIELRAPSKS